MKTIISSLLALISVVTFAQKKTLDHADFDIWNTIENQSIAPDGNYIMYSLEKGERDNHLKIKDSKAVLVFEHERGEKGQFTFDSKFALFTVKAWQDSVREMKRRKVKKNDLPKDTLAIYSLGSKTLTKVGNIKSYKIPEKWAGYVAYQLEEIKVEKKKEGDDEEAEPKEKKAKKKSLKKVGKDNGYHLVLRNLSTGNQDTIKYVTSYVFAKEGKRMAYSTTGMDSTIQAGIYVVNLDNNQNTNVFASKKGKYNNLAFSDLVRI